MDLCTRIRLRRKAAGLTAAQLAAAVGVTRGAVTQWENPRYQTQPTSSNLQRIAAACGVTLAEFYGEISAASKEG